jgi:hypothetical protein
MLSDSAAEKQAQSQDFLNDAQRTAMTDRFCIAAPLPVLGPIAEAIFLRRYMLALLRERNAVIKQVAESSDWQRYLQSEPDQERCASL